ncbi:SAM-dependent methyltransferase [Ornithinibacillus gellani]|uniref:class I SAM-dependent methyltransferase n=1 Tax=Ornithinibacillus gellani TaxID=2293253 RepID=UPI000F498041|nr:SAM-dependent methyltransferase [Ornithinibacillus gellani]TQS70526.1 SAM-dependent methyltransferase [Ornithinibacillus gellani]
MERVQLSEVKVVIGAGDYINNPGWLHTNEKELDLLNEVTWKSKFAKATIQAILAEHVWEHLTYEEGLAAAKRCFIYLKPSGYIRCAVPDGFFPDEQYQHIIQIGGPGPADHPAADHKMVYNYRTLSAMFEMAGFEVKLLEYCDENGHFHHKHWKKEDGVIFRSKQCDPRNQGDRLKFPSLIIDAVKSK